MPSVVAEIVCAVLAGTAIGYFIPRSRNVVERIDADSVEGGDEADEPQAHRLERFFDMAEEAAIVCDARGRVVAANAAAGLLFGFDRRTASGRALIEVAPSAELDAALARALAGERVHTVVDCSAGGEIRTLDVVAERIDRDEAIVVLVDRTPLLEANRARMEFLGSISHELRTPLAGLKLMMETVQTEHDAHAAEFFLPKIAAEIDRMVELVEHLLEVARSESGRITLEVAPLLLDRVAAAALDAVEPRLAERGIALRRELVEAPIEADGPRLSQVVVNLLENAIRHTPRGGAIDVRVRLDEEEAIFEVADTGVGIPFKELRRIFERFYVVDRSRARATGGLGLGLAIAKGNVEAHRGTIEVESELGAGSTFRVRLPRRQRDNPAIRHD